MASVSSASPSGHSFPNEESESDWEQIDSNPSPSINFSFHSPASGSLSSWGIVNYPNQQPGPSPPAISSPLDLEDRQQNRYSTPLSEHQPDVPLATTAADLESQFMSTFGGQNFYTGQEFVFADQFTGPVDSSPFMNSFTSDISDLTGLESLSATSHPQQHGLDFGIPQHYKTSGNDVQPWGPTNLHQGIQPPTSAFHDAFKQQSIQQLQMQQQQQQPRSQPPPQVLQHSSSSSHHSPLSASRNSSPKSPEIKIESGRPPTPIRKIKGGKSSKVEKRKAEPSSKFVIMTPNLINAQSGKPNPFECFEAMRATQRGRKGPLAMDTKESALQVRRRGACFCCHSRKVKCDSERPCKNCKKLTTQVPQIMCWQFQDFLPVLFPDFIRGHLRREMVSTFISDNVLAFKVDGVDQPCSVELFTGSRFQSTLSLPANFFTAKTAEVLQHWHTNYNGGQPQMQSLAAVPIGIDPENSAQREELKKRSRDYIHNLTFEPFYAEQVTDAIRTTRLPQKVLKIVQRFSQRTNSPMTKRALSIYVLHYVLTRQLCFTETAIFNLQQTSLVPINGPVLTSRILNRQIKAVLDELLLKEMQSLFDSFSKSLKPKSKKEWAPCLASFLVLCLFMESVETAADTFVVSENELFYRGAAGVPGGNMLPPPFQRDFSVNICKEIDNMPFKQFAYQFHQVYQTHTKDATTKAFNPLAGEDATAQRAELLASPHDGQATSDMVSELAELLEGDGWHEMDFLVQDPVLPTGAGAATSRSLDYTGKLLARFLLSFTDEKYLFDGQF